MTLFLLLASFTALSCAMAIYYWIDNEPAASAFCLCMVVTVLALLGLLTK